MGNVVDRLKEPSTHAGLAAVFQGLQLLLPHYSAVFTTLTLIFGGLAAAVPEAAAK